MSTSWEIKKQKGAFVALPYLHKREKRKKWQKKVSIVGRLHSTLSLLHIKRTRFLSSPHIILSIVIFAF